jgi:hypothetical protein
MLIFAETDHKLRGLEGMDIVNLFRASSSGYYSHSREGDDENK